VSYTGFDETQVVSSPDKGMNSRISLPESPYVLFRGKVNDEAGLKNIVNAFSKYDVIAPLVIMTNRDLNLGVDNGRIQVIKGFVSMKEMSDLYNGAALCLGQLSLHPRLARTIPHKAFEAGFYGVPYISIKSVAISEIFPNEKTCHYLDNDSPKEIAQAVNEILSDAVLVHNYAQEIQNAYRLKISQEKIHLDFVETLASKGFKLL
jgi:glycosyltransferase involved in cell wall biosynthesis